MQNNGTAPGAGQGTPANPDDQQTDPAGETVDESGGTVDEGKATPAPRTTPTPS